MCKYSKPLYTYLKVSFCAAFFVHSLKVNIVKIYKSRSEIQRLWVIWGQCCPRVVAAPSLPNGPITQLSPYLTRKPGTRCLYLPSYHFNLVGICIFCRRVDTSGSSPLSRSGMHHDLIHSYHKFINWSLWIYDFVCRQFDKDRRRVHMWGHIKNWSKLTEISRKDHHCFSFIHQFNYSTFD